MKTDLSNDDVVVKLGTTPHMILTTEQSPTLAGPPANARSGVAGECGRRLLLAARAGDTATLRQLIAKGAPFTADWLGTSPLHLAAQHDHVEAVAVLLRAGVSRDARTKVERTPLHLAAYAGHARVIRELLEQGAAVDARDLLRMTPLHWAVERGHIAAATALLAAGADPHAESKFHKTPMILAAAAAARGRPQMLQLLEDVIQQREKPQPEVEPNTVDDDQERASVEAAAATEAVRQTQTEPPSPGGTGAALLRRHGITLLPADDGSTVLSALQSGRTVVLSDAGRLMLKESNCQKDGVLLTATPVAAPPKGVKVFTLSSQAKVIPPRRKPAPAPPPPTPPTNPLPPTAPAQVKLVSLQSPHPGPAAVGSAVRIIMNRKNLKKLIATATRAAAIPENEVDSEGADDEESVVVVPEQFVRSSSPQYLRSQLLCAHAAIHHLSSRLRNAHAKLAQLQSSNNSSTTIGPP